MFGTSKPSTVKVRGKIAFDHIPSFLGKETQKSTNTFLVQLCPHWNFTESEAVKYHLEWLWMWDLTALFKLA